MKLLNWIKNLFKTKESPKPETPKTSNSEIPNNSNSSETPSSSNSSTTSNSSKKLKIAIVRGHGGKDGGASGCGTTEVEYNTWVMKEIEKLNLPNVKCFYGDNSISAVLKSLAFLPDLTMQLHLNSAGPTAHGCEVLVLDGDTKSYPFAEKFASMFCKKFNRRMRGEHGKKRLKSGDRGLSSLKTSTFGAKILCEPWFISRQEEFVPKEEYLEFLIKYIEEVG